MVRATCLHDALRRASRVRAISHSGYGYGVSQEIVSIANSVAPARLKTGFVIDLAHVVVDKLPSGQLETKRDRPRRTVQPDRTRVFERTWHQSPAVRPRHPPASERGQANGSSASPTAGRPLWQRTMSDGSSLPTCRPAIKDSLVVTWAKPVDVTCESISSGDAVSDSRALLSRSG